MKIQNRLREYLAFKSLSNKDFEKMCGLGNGTAARISEKSRKTIIDRISINSDLNTEWLLTGEGEMLREEQETSLTPRSENEDNYRMVPIIHIDSVGGIHSENSILSPEYLEGYVPITGAREGDVAIYQSGNSMAPAIPPGALLQIREVVGWQEYIGYGDVFVLLLDDDRRITKEIQRYREDPKNYFWCVSYNPDVADEELPKRMVRRVWKVIKVLIDKGW